MSPPTHTLRTSVEVDASVLGLPGTFGNPAYWDVSVHHPVPDNRTSGLRDDSGAAAGRPVAPGANGAIQIDAVVPTDIRAHSMVGLAAHRAGATVSLRTSARSYDLPSDDYTAQSHHDVVVQRWSHSGWSVIARLTLDARGNGTAAVTVPFRVAFRVVDAATHTVWDSRSSTVVL